MPRRERAVGVTEALGEASRSAEHRASRGAVGFERGEALEHVQPGLIAALRFEQRREPARHGECDLGGGVGAREDLREVNDRAGGVFEHVGPHGARADEEVEAQRGVSAGGARDGFGAAGERVGEARVKARALGELGELREVLGVAGVQRDELGVVRGRVAVASSSEESRREVGVDARALGLVARDAEGHREDAEHVVAASGRVEARAEDRDGAARDVG